MTVTICCPNLRCRTILEVPEKARGRRVRCSKCGTNFVVPQKAEPKKPPRPAPPAADPSPAAEPSPTES